ncbi:GNAT family N-acetyltransferase [Pseudonocardia sp. ICBG1142]|uniref:GNAT family N-acetyltransferase n=1 Tax=Pseudonocardia sp. ICBG1142 TaxID=2846760 RepID=UPI001CF66AB1
MAHRHRRRPGTVRGHPLRDARRLLGFGLRHAGGGPVSCTVRPRRSEDLSVLAEVLVRVHAADGYPVEGVANPGEWLDQPRTLGSWVALVGDSPVGQVILKAAEKTDDAAAAWAIHTGGEITRLALVVRLFVDPDHRKVGAGRKLLAAALDRAHILHRAVALDVMEKDRDAIRLYRRMGGVQLSRIVHQHSEGQAEGGLVFGFGSLT